jgi:hypothetical protein
MHNLMSALGNNIKKSGKNWLAKCPVHQDKDFAMTIKQNHDNSIIAHCFACGANGLDLYRCLDLDLDELFGDVERGGFSVSEKIIREYEQDLILIKIYEAHERQGRVISYKDRIRYKLAVARSAGAKIKYNL